MSGEILRNWEARTDQRSIGEVIKGAISTPPPLKQRIDYVCRILDIQTSRIEQIYNRLYERDRRLFEQLVNFYLKRDTSRIKVYANEIAGIRKLERVILQSKYALQAVKLRLEFVKDVGEIAVTLAPAMQVIRSVRTQLANILPDAERELSGVGEVIGSMLTEVGHPPTSQFTFESVNEEAERILNEAKIMVEKELKEKFAEIPSVVKEMEKSQE